MKFCPKCDIGTCTTLVWGGPSVVSDGPSLIESCDFCVSMERSSTIGLQHISQSNAGQKLAAA